MSSLDKHAILIYMSKTSKIITVSILILLALGLSAAAVLVLYQGKIFPVLDRVVQVPFLETQPAAVVQTMQSTMGSIKTAHYNLELEVSQPSSTVPFKLMTTIRFDGGFSDAITGELATKNKLQLLNITYLFNIDLHLTADATYFRVSEFPALPYLDVATIEDVWYHREPLTLGTSDKAHYNDTRTIIERTQLFDVVERKPDAVLLGQEVYHFVLTVNEKNLKELSVLINQEHLQRYDGFQLEAWIGKQDNYLYRAVGTLEDDSLKIVAELNVSDFNKDVTIEIPGEKKSIALFSKALFGKSLFLEIPIFLKSSGVDVQEFSEDKDKDGLYMLWERLFGTDEMKADTDGDGFSDSEEIKNGYNPKGEGKLFTYQ